MSLFPSLELSPLKKSLGPPDVYPQDPKQREDSLCSDNLSKGFKSIAPVSNEFVTSKDKVRSINSQKIWSFFHDVISKKKELKTCPDTSKNKKIISSGLKDNLLHPIDKNKEIIDHWFKDLAGSVPLTKLASKRIPFFPKKEEIIQELYKYNVSISRGIWFIKMGAMHASAMAESNKKKTRTAVDPTVEWCNILCRCLQNILNKFKNDSFMDTQLYNDLHDQWRYYFRLTIAMYDQDLLDHWEMLLWFVETLEKLNEETDIDGILKLLLPYVLQVGPRFSESEIITRRLLYWVCNTFANIILDDPQVQPYVDSPTAFQSLMENYLELNSCPLHRTIILSLSGLIMGLSQMCPSAVVWNNVNNPENYLHGSPLDVIPCSLSALPSPPGPESVEIRKSLKSIENTIVQRSIMAERCWYKKPTCTSNNNLQTLIQVLELLDQHDYDTVLEDLTLETLFNKIFDSERNVDHDSPLVVFLCEWVTTPTRTGVHRPIIVATLLEKLEKAYNSMGSQNVFQDSLMKFLDQKAPYLDNQSEIVTESFKNLVCLFGELIDRQVFCHDTYVRTFIARGIFESGGHLLSSASHFAPLSCQEEETDRIHFDNPDSVKSDNSVMTTNVNRVDFKRLNKHVQYLVHIPLPQDDSYGHEINQRLQILYGVNRARETAKHILKRLVRDICKLFNKRIYLVDIVHGEAGKRKKKDDSLKLDAIQENIMKRFKHLSYYDMEYVITQCIPTFTSIMRGTYQVNKGSGERNHQYLPAHTTIPFFFSLIEMSLNYTCLVQTVVETLVHFQNFVDRLQSKTWYLVMYQNVLCLYIIGVLRKYQAVLMTMEEQKISAFKMLIQMVRSVGNPAQCSSMERCILAYLHDVFNSSYVVQRYFSNIYSKASVKVSSALFKRVEPSKGNSEFDETFAKELINSPTNIQAIDEELRKNPDLCYSFVCNIMLNICQNPNAEHVNNLCNWCAETTAKCCSLQSEWLGALNAVISPRAAQHGYTHITQMIDLNNSEFYDNIALFVGTLLARQCFPIKSFLQYVILPAMARCIDQTLTPLDPSLEPTIRIVCHMLHRLFTIEYAGGNGKFISFSIPPFKFSEPLLLSGALQKISTENLVDILKMLIVLGDKANASSKKKSLPSETFDCNSLDDKDSADVKHIKLSSFTQLVLREICNVPWVRKRFSRESASFLIRDNVLLDNIITSSQARHLLNIICRPCDGSWVDIVSDVSNAMTRLLKNLDVWTLRFNNMELQLLLKQIPPNQQHEVLETVAKAIIDMFQSQAEAHVYISIDAALPDAQLEENHNSWLVPPLISQLPEPLKNQLIKAASEKLEGAKNFWSLKNDQDKERNLQGSSVVLAYPPFVTLLLSCLECDDRKDNLLQSLRNQIDYFVQNAIETEDKVPDDLRIRHILQECLQVRLGLVGNLFERIQIEDYLSTDWCFLLSQLITYGVVELHSNQELFYTVIDMLSTLIHTLIANGGSDKSYQNVAKKIRKEIADKISEGVDLIKPLLPLLKNTYDVIVTAPHKNSTRNSRVRKNGYVVQKKEKLNPWDVIEGVKHQFSLSWFGTIRCDNSAPRIEQQANLLLSHDHFINMQKPASYFIQAPELPEEDAKSDPGQSSVPEDTQLSDLVSAPSSLFTSVHDGNLPQYTECKKHAPPPSSIPIMPHQPHVPPHSGKPDSTMLVTGRTSATSKRKKSSGSSSKAKNPRTIASPAPSMIHMKQQGLSLSMPPSNNQRAVMEQPDSRLNVGSAYGGVTNTIPNQPQGHYYTPNIMPTAASTQSIVAGPASTNYYRANINPPFNVSPANQHFTNPNIPNQMAPNRPSMPTHRSMQGRPSSMMSGNSSSAAVRQQLITHINQGNRAHDPIMSGGNMPMYQQQIPSTSNPMPNPPPYTAQPQGGQTLLHEEHHHFQQGMPGQSSNSFMRRSRMSGHMNQGGGPPPTDNISGYGLQTQGGPQQMIPQHQQQFMMQQQQQQQQQQQSQQAQRHSSITFKY